MSFPDEQITWAKKNKLLSIVLAVAILFVLSVSFMFLQSGLMYASQMVTSESLSEGYYAPGMAKSGDFDSVNYRHQDSADSGAYVEVKEGSMRIETKDAENDADSIKGLTADYEGYMENMRKSETDLYLNIYLRARIPSEKFDGYVEQLKSRYDEKSFNINFYRLSTERELGEIELIQKTLDDYEAIRIKANNMELSKDQLNMLLLLTKNELELKRLARQYESSLTGKEKRSEYATLSITLEQKKDAKIMPENLGNRFRNKIKNALDDIANSSMDIITGSVSLFFAAIKYAVYLIVLFIPLMVCYRVLKRIYSRYFG